MSFERLSICIPTYNRKPFLEWTVKKTLEDFPDARIIVSDNASSDGTADLDLGAVGYIRQATNTGAFPNLRSVLLASRTEYAVYLGDDDYLLPEEVARGIAFLDENPEVIAYFAPCQLYDEVKKEVAFHAFYPSENRTFGSDRPDLLWNWLLQNHVWPEHAIYRRRLLPEIMHPRGRPYWAFVDFGNAQALGPVHFARDPYYRNLTGHPVGRRGKLGDAQCLTDFEEYRAGLELMAFRMFKDHLTDEIRRAVQDGIRQFINARYAVAQRILLAQNRLAEAETLGRRMAVAVYSTETQNG